MKTIKKSTAKSPRLQIRRSVARAALLVSKSKADLSSSPDPKWAWHYKRLLVVRDRLFDERRERSTEAAEQVEPHSMSIADSASDEIEHDLALAELSAEQDALYEIDEALLRIRNGTYGMCELTGEPISAARLRAVPWARFASQAEAQLEAHGQVRRPHLGTLGSVRREGQRTLEEAEEETQLPFPEDEMTAVSIPKSESSTQHVGRKSKTGRR